MRGNTKKASAKVNRVLCIALITALVFIDSCSIRLSKEKIINQKLEIMAIKKRSSFKLLAAPVASLADVIPEPGGIFLFEGILYYCDKFGFHPFTPGQQSQDFCALDIQTPPLPGTSGPALTLLDFFDNVFFNTATAFTVNIPGQSVTMVKNVDLHITVSMTMEVSDREGMVLALMKDGVEVQRIEGRPSIQGKPVQFYFDFFESYLLGEVLTFEIASDKAITYDIQDCSTGILNLTL